jgi:predicted flap endonuclease-1-like 5' DNA nuclease
MATRQTLSNSDFPKTSAPAQRALDAEGITSLDQLAQHTEKEIADLHGVGPKAIRIWRAALAERGLAFKDRS